MSYSNAIVPRSAAQDELEFSNTTKRAVARGVNKHLKVVEKKLRSLDLELVQTKSNIIKNVLKSRSIEKSHNRLSTTQSLLQQQVLTLSHPELPHRLRERQIALAKDFSLPLDNTLFNYVTFLTGELSANGLATILIQAFNSYSLRDVKRIILSTPAEKTGQITLEQFVELARNCGNGCFSPYEATKVYDATTDTNSPQATKWQNLKRMILRKVITDQVVAAGIKYLRDLDLEQQRHFKFPPSHLLQRSNSFQQQQQPTTSTSMQSHELATSSSVSMLSSTSVLKPRKMPPASKLAAPDSIESLSKELNKSKQHQRKLQEQIALNLADFYANKGPNSVKTVSTSASMAQYFKSMAAKKLHALLLPRAKQMMVARLGIWKQVLRVILMEKDCQKVAKALAVARLVRVLQWSDLARTSNWFNRWHRTILYLNQNEAEAAAIEIQRSFRGYLTRQKVRKMMTLRAATAIQNTFRVHIAKKFARKAMRRRLIRLSVHKIEKLWKAFRWRRTLKKVFLHQRQTRAARLIQRVWRGHRGRQRYHLKLLRRLQLQATIKFQAVYRRYRATLLVDAKRLFRRRTLAAIVIQKYVRGHQTRKRWAVRWKRHVMAKVVQYAWMCSKARKEVWRRRQRRAAILMQLMMRSRIARSKVQRIRQEKHAREEAERQRRQEAIARICPLGLGFITRRRFGAPLRAHLARRQRAAMTLQRGLKAIYLGLQARRRVKRIRADRADSLRRNKAAIQIQRIIRGVRDRRLVVQIRQDLAQELDARQRWPLYFRLKESYLKSQDLYHRKKVVKIQALIRRYLARKKVTVKRRDRSAKTIQSFMSSRKIIMEAKSVRMELASKKYARVNLVPRIQKVVRGYLVRNRLRKAAATAVIRWAIKEITIRRHIAGAINNFRIRKAIEEERQEAAIRMQALIRGFLGKRRYKKGFKSLQRQRAIRVRAKRMNAALIIQCAFRCYRARMRVVKQRMLYAEREHERRELDALEKSIEGLHDAFMTELLVIRAQTGIRGKLARQ